jgi:hypothetical protein
MSACSRRRPAEAGSVEQAMEFFAHQVGKPATAARLRFHVAGSARPHNSSRTSASRGPAIPESCRSGPSSSAGRSGTLPSARRVFAFWHLGQDRNRSSATRMLTAVARCTG